MAPPRVPHHHHRALPKLSAIEVDVAASPGQSPAPIMVPAGSPEEAFRILYSVGNGVAGSGARHFYYGSVLEPIRNAYKVELEGIERSILDRRQALGANPTEYELRGLAQWAARQRARTARIYRIPTPSLAAGLEARDWNKYGIGGRTFENLLKRNAQRGITGAEAYERIIGSAAVSNAEVNATVSRGAQFLRRGGGVLAVAGLALSAYDIIHAPPGHRMERVEHQAVGFAGGLIGSEIGAGLLAVGAGFLAATPPGWLVIGVGLIAGFIGATIAEKVVFPPDHRVVANQFEAGIAVDPRHLPMHAHAPGHRKHAPTTLPVPRHVVLMVEPHDTQQLICHRAYAQAAASVGLSGAAQASFADKWCKHFASFSWTFGDPTPHTDATVRRTDLSMRTGQRVSFELSEKARSELAHSAE